MISWQEFCKQRVIPIAGKLWLLFAVVIIADSIGSLTILEISKRLLKMSSIVFYGGFLITLVYSIVMEDY